MTLLLVALAHAVPTCVQASTECALPVGPCLFVQSASDPACVNWDVDSGAIVVMPGSTLDVTLQQNTFLETLHVGVEREQLPEALDDWLTDDPSGGPGPTNVTVDANGYDLQIGPSSIGPIHPVKAVDATVVVDGAYIVGFSAESCVYAHESDVTIQGSEIAFCYADLGGGIYAQGGELTVEDTTFWSNTGEVGGDVWTDGVLTLMNTDHAEFGAYERAGSVYIDGPDATIDGSTFADGFAGISGGIVQVGDGATGTTHIVRTDMAQAFADYGGAIAVADGSLASLVVEDATFTNTAANFEGGAIYLDSDSAGATVSHTSFSGNEAWAGGAIAARADLDLWSSRIEDTRGWLAGGAVAATDGADVKIVNSGFLGSEANDGGGLYLENIGSAAIEGSWFCDNVAFYDGGGVYLNHSTDDVVVRHTLFQRTSASWGSVWSHRSTGDVLMDHVSAIDFDRAPVEDPGGFVSVEQSVLYRSGAWDAARFPGNAVFTSDNHPELLHGAAPSPCGAPFLLHPTNDPAHDGPEALYDATGVWSLDDNFGPFGLDANNPVPTGAGLLDPLYVDVTADASSGVRPPAADWYGDGDGDGFPTMLDCNDADASVHPGATERCFDGLDNDCDALIDTADDNLETYFLDEDQDGSLEVNAPVFTDCTGDPDDLVASSDVVPGVDCAPDDPLVYEGAPELCDGKDNDCDGLVDGFDEDSTAEANWFLDPDSDGWGHDDDVVAFCGTDGEALALGLVPLDKGGDCDDHDPGVFPGAIEYCNGLDDDCTGVADDADAQAWLPDPDGDGHVAEGAVAEDGCVPDGIGFVLVEDVQGFDCDEGDPMVNSSADEVCGDQVDNDCSPDTDDMMDAERYFPDEDVDGFGDWDSDGFDECPERAEGRRLATNALDCDDGNHDIKPGVEEIVDNGVDEDCDGLDATRFAAGGCQVAPVGFTSLWARRR